MEQGKGVVNPMSSIKTHLHVRLTRYFLRASENAGKVCLGGITVLDGHHR